METRKYKNAPLQELVCGVRIPKGILNINLISTIYNEFKNFFPTIEEVAPLDDDILPPILHGSLYKERESKPTYVRYWLVSQNQNKLIQLQDGAIYCNWRKVTKSELYPKYNEVFRDLNNVIEFIKVLVNSNIPILATELSYLNHIFPNQISMNPGRLDHMVNFCTFSNFFENVNAYKIKLNVPLEKLFGIYFLEINTNKLIRTKDDLIIWNHGIKGTKFENTVNLTTWFDQAHQIINERFDEITTLEFKNKIGNIEKN